MAKLIIVHEAYDNTEPLLNADQIIYARSAPSAATNSETSVKQTEGHTLAIRETIQQLVVPSRA